MIVLSLTEEGSFTAYDELDYTLDAIDDIIKISKYGQQVSLRPAWSESREIMQDTRKVAMYKKMGLVTHTQKQWYDD